MLLTATTIRLSLYDRRREVEVMKLVGATDWFIRWPFVLEGVIVGALGGILAILLLAVVKIAVVDPLAADFALIAAPDTIDFRLLIGILLIAAIGVSALGSGLSPRRFLRVWPLGRPRRRGGHRRAPRRDRPASRSPRRPRARPRAAAPPARPGHTRRRSCGPRSRR